MISKMDKLKKIILLITGPGVIAFEAIVIFIHLFTTNNTKPWIIGGLVIFFLVFIPLYSIEYFKQNFRDEKQNKSFQFKKRNTRTEWEGGSVHGRVTKDVERPGKIFNK